MKNLLLILFLLFTSCFATSAEIGRLPSDKPNEREEFNAKRFLPGPGAPPNSLMNAHLQRQQMMGDVIRNAINSPRNFAGINTASWQSLGPEEFGGNVSSIVSPSNNSNILFAGTPNSGLWKSTNRGLSWAPVESFPSILRISAVKISKQNPSIMYVATGSKAAEVQGSGIFKSIDGGMTWNQLSSSVGSFVRGYVKELAVSPGNPSVLLASSFWNIQRSIDGGMTWTIVYPGATACDIEFVESNSNKVVAGACDGYGMTPTSIIYSNDAGQTWLQSSGVPIQQRTIDLEFSKSSPSIVYALAAKNNGSNIDQLYKSTNYGASFSLVSNTNHTGGNGSYNNVLWVDPIDPNHLIIGGVILYRSVNGGVSFYGLNSYNSFDLSMITPHADNHVIYSDSSYNGVSNKRIYFGNDGGINATDNISSVQVGSEAGWLRLSNGLTISQAYSVDGVGDAIVAGFQDNGTLKWIPGTKNWSRLAYWDGGEVSISHYSPELIVSEYQQLRPNRTLNGVFSSLCSGLADGCGVNESEFIAPLQQSTTRPGTIFGGGRKLWRNAGASLSDSTNYWQVIDDPMLGVYEYIDEIYVKPDDSGIVWYSGSGRIFYSANAFDAAPTFVEVSSPCSAVSVAMSLYVDTEVPGRAYVSCGGGIPAYTLFRTDNNGLSWIDIKGNLPEGSVTDITRHPLARDWLYVGTGVGVFASENGGQSWFGIDGGPKTATITELSWSDDRTLLAATFGRGIFRIPLDQFQVMMASGNNQTQTVDATFSTPISVRVVDQQGNAIPGVDVSFSSVNSSSGAGAIVASPVVKTNASGIAQVTVRANTRSGDYSVLASLNATTTPVTFALRNVPAEPVLNCRSGCTQTAVVGQSFAPALVAASDQFGNAISGLPLSIVAPPVGASSNPAGLSVSTNAAGEASISVSANTVSGSYSISVSSASVATATSLSFTNLAGAPHQMLCVSGCPQSQTVNWVYGQPIRFRVTDIHGNPVPGNMVSLYVPGVEPRAILPDQEDRPGFPSVAVRYTDSAGVIDIVPTAGSQLGSYMIQAAFGSASSIASFGPFTNARPADFGVSLIGSTVRIQNHDPVRSGRLFVRVTLSWVSDQTTVSGGPVGCKQWPGSTTVTFGCPVLLAPGEARDWTWNISTTGSVMFEADVVQEQITDGNSSNDRATGSYSGGGGDES